ncbi:glycosyltransferase (plasmid) [Paracoccus liaowanqingii]|uniref:Glycosyltransferase n=1 Tax=Paracoccus liaowanqingii TaxID=2560053 RepID=A0A4Y5SQA6_9RHOB|nr:glycosyltransferase [Paracoccus liaowanqingii]QDA35671.1 glycosyltransferase [Paracoccus liaowanqingii]
MSRLRVLVLAESCNPDWPSLPVVGYKYARALGQVVDMTLVTHIRNRENIEMTGEMTGSIHYIDNEWLAAPMYRLASRLRGGSEVAWSTNQIMAYPPYLFFERQTWSRFRKDMKAGAFDLVHRITPMSPTLPSWIAGRGNLPFVIGPLNGNLDWPTQFAEEQKRERERLRKLRDLYKFLPYARRTYRRASAVLAAFEHTVRDLSDADPDRVIPMPEIGFDPQIFYAEGRRPAFSGSAPYRFLYAGRLVPYKLPEVAIRAFISSHLLRLHRLHIVGDGPELGRLQKLVVSAGAENQVFFEGRKTQSDVAQSMRDCDAFVFPSIRELGAGVVIEAMASGIPCIVAEYGAPADLAAKGRGIRIPLASREEMIITCRQKMEACVQGNEDIQAITERAKTYATTLYKWERKAAYTLEIYRTVLEKRSLKGLKDYL